MDDSEIKDQITALIQSNKGSMDIDRVTAQAVRLTDSFLTASRILSEMQAEGKIRVNGSAVSLGE